MRVLAAALGRHVGHRAFQDFQQRLLHAFAADVAGDRGIFVFLGDLVDLVDVNDALLGFADVAVGGLEQLQDDVLDVFADVAGLGKRGGIHDGEGHIEHARKRLRQQRLAGAGRADEQNVGFRKLDFAGLAVEENALVVVVHGDGEFFLRFVLADDVAIEELLDLRGPRQAALRRRRLARASRLRGSVWQTLTHSLQMYARG